MAPKRKASKTPKPARARGPQRTKAMVDDNQWFVDGILGEDVKGGVLKYRVKWQGYAEKESTWEKREDISDDIFAAYQRMRRNREEGEEEEEEEEEEQDREDEEKATTTKKRKSLRTLPAEPEAKRPVSTNAESIAAHSIEHESTDSSLSDPPNEIETPHTSVRALIAYSQASSSADADFEYDDNFEAPAAVPSEGRDAPAVHTAEDEFAIITPEEVEAVLGVDLGLGRFWEAS